MTKTERKLNATFRDKRHTKESEQTPSSMVVLMISAALSLLNLIGASPVPG